jgi:cyclohexanecarboxyl-CoA dehydrogenase
MDFRFSKDEELWQWAVKDFADREIAPKEITKSDHIFRETVKKMGDLGFLGVGIPEEYGGDPASWVMLGILIEELARVNAGIAYFMLVSHEVASSLASHGSDEVKQEWLSSLLRGDKIGCYCVTEPSAGTDFGTITSTASKNGDRYLVTGEKGPVSFGMDADVALTFLRTAPDGKEGVTAMAIPLGLPGISRLAGSNMGLFVAMPASLRFDRVSIPVTYRIGEEGSGFRVNATTGLFSCANQILSGMISLAVAQAASKLAIQYSKERYAFGSPIAKFEAISNKIAEDLTLLEAGRWLCYRALSLKDQEVPNAKEAAMCGWWCPKIAYQAIQNSLLIHGHAGYCDDHPIQQMLRDIVGFEMISGTEQMLKLIISHEAIGPTGVPDVVLNQIGNH